MRRIIQRHITTIQITSVEIMWDEDNGPDKESSGDLLLALPIGVPDAKPPASPTIPEAEGQANENDIEGFATQAEIFSPLTDIKLIQE